MGMSGGAACHMESRPANCNAFAFCVLPSSFLSHSTRSQSGSVK
jgi:hypothetical protein